MLKLKSRLMVFWSPTPMPLRLTQWLLNSHGTTSIMAPFTPLISNKRDIMSQHIRKISGVNKVCLSISYMLKPVLFIFLVLITASCSNEINTHEPHFPHAVLRPAWLSRGDLATEIYAIFSTTSGNELFSYVSPNQVIYLRPGKYRIEVGCYRFFRDERGNELSWIFFDNAPSIIIDMKADITYVVDCEPSEKDEGFVVNDKYYKSFNSDASEIGAG